MTGRRDKTGRLGDWETGRKRLRALSSSPSLLFSASVFTVLFPGAVAARAETLDWKASAGAAGYRIYWQGAPAATTPFPPLRLDRVVDAGPNLSVNLALTPGWRYAFVCRAYDALGREGALSNGVGYTKPSGPVAGPANLRVVLPP